jgi:hypothetical protein
LDYKNLNPKPFVCFDYKTNKLVDAMKQLNWHKATLQNKPTLSLQNERESMKRDRAAGWLAENEMENK